MSSTSVPSICEESQQDLLDDQSVLDNQSVHSEFLSVDERSWLEEVAQGRQVAAQERLSASVSEDTRPTAGGRHGVSKMGWSVTPKLAMEEEQELKVYMWKLSAEQIVRHRDIVGTLPVQPWVGECGQIKQCWKNAKEIFRSSPIQGYAKLIL